MKPIEKRKVNKNIIALNKEILFIESFVRKVEFIGRVNATKLPENTLFYIGSSKAQKVKYFQNGWKDSFEKYFGYKNNKPCLLENKKQNLDISDQRIEAIVLLAEEYFDNKENIWLRNKDKINLVKRDISPQNKSKPFSQFNVNGIRISEIDESGNFISLFPRGINNPIEINKTYVYLLHYEEYDYYDFGIQPNSYLAHFFKNYGFHKEIILLDEDEFSEIDSSKFCVEELKIRDYRKSNKRFEY